MDTKKIVGIGVGIVVVLAIALAIIFNPFKKDEGQVDDTTVDNSGPTQEQIKDAEDVQKYMPDKTIDEILAIDETELTEEKENIFDDVIDDHTIYEVDEIISTPDDQDLENESPEIVYKDKDGNIHTVDVTEEEWNMTDEEAEEEMRRMEEEMDQRMKEYEERWNKKQNGEKVDPITPPAGDYQDDMQYDPSGENNAYDPYDGYGSYEAYIDHICEVLPHRTREEIIQMFPDPATGEAGPSTANDMEKGLLGGN